MWLVGFNELAYVALNLASGRFPEKFFPLSARA
jgi:thiosulfate reductase cytochrome b subunit